MHELSLITNALDIAKESMKKHGLTRLISLKFCHGELSQVVPEAMFSLFDLMIENTELQGAKLELEEIPLKLACGACKNEFSPQRKSPKNRQSIGANFECPACKESQGHTILTGKELYIAQIEAE